MREVYVKTKGGTKVKRIYTDDEKQKRKEIFNRDGVRIPCVIHYEKLTKPEITAETNPLWELVKQLPIYKAGKTPEVERLIFDQTYIKLKIGARYDADVEVDYSKQVEKWSLVFKVRDYMRDIGLCDIVKSSAVNKKLGGRAHLSRLVPNTEYFKEEKIHNTFRYCIDDPCN